MVFAPCANQAPIRGLQNILKRLPYNCGYLNTKMSISFVIIKMGNMYPKGRQKLKKLMTKIKLKDKSLKNYC